MGCIFCEILAGNLASSIVYQDDVCIALMDLYPIQSGHVLVVPRTHQVFLEGLSPEVRSHLFEVGNWVIRAQKKAGLHYEGHNLLINDGPVAQQHVPHVHLHVIPRHKGDLAKTAFNFFSRNLNRFGEARKRKELDQLAAKIAEHMPVN